MTIDTSNSGGMASAVINSATCADDVLVAHLRAALERTQDPTARFHIREALQLLAAE